MRNGRYRGRRIRVPDDEQHRIIHRVHRSRIRRVGAAWTCHAGKHAIAFIEAAQATGREGKTASVLNERRSSSPCLTGGSLTDEAHAAAVDHVNGILKGGSWVQARTAPDGTIEMISTRRSQAQRVLDEQIHTVFGEVVAASNLAASRTYYAKAKRYLTAADPDYENAAKEAVLAVESIVVTLTGEADFTKAIRKATAAELIPRPLDDIAIKLYAYRGNEPGVTHAGESVPDVTQLEAELVFNLDKALSAHIRAAARKAREALDVGSQHKAHLQRGAMAFAINTIP